MEGVWDGSPAAARKQQDSGAASQGKKAGPMPLTPEAFELLEKLKSYSPKRLTEDQ